MASTTAAGRFARPISTLGLALFGLTGVGAAQEHTLTVGKPADVGMSAGILAGGVARYQEAVDAGDLVGVVLLVAKDGKVVLHEALGWRDKARGIAMEKSTMFRMASNTKPVVATAIGILADRKQLAYDDLVRASIPRFDNYRAGFIQIHHLLTHTSGFRIGTLFLPAEQGAPENAVRTLQSEVARFGPVGAAVLPGTSFSYSNPGFNTLGALIEIKSGKPLEVFLRDEIYQPLGMVDSYHMETADKLDGKLGRMSVVYYQKKDGEWVPGWTPGDPPQVPFVRASGGMISTAWDYAIFLQTFLNGGSYGGRRILERKTVERMTSPLTRHDLGERVAGYTEGHAYGYGWSVAPDGVYSHSGSDGTMAWVDPARNLFGLVFTQTPRGRNPTAEFQALVDLALEAGPDAR
ncbi:MAG: serine hydrolase domain-containing protein [Gemmatimonadales bacterium]